MRNFVLFIENYTLNGTLLELLDNYNNSHMMMMRRWKEVIRIYDTLKFVTDKQP